ncbi:MAG: F0F1 ATP synthase subunit B [Alphaproteobacteria bacterium]|nr:F0F1 ATP synthase subunit B [Alphaproteobacteria bacterium]
MAEEAKTIEHVGAPEHHPEPANFGFMGAPQWIALAMLAVFAVMLWKRVPALIGQALDQKIAGIRAELDEAEQLRKDAEALKAEYEAKAAAADAERATMIERARHEADAIVAQAEADTAALIERRTRMAEDKIAAAERHALDEVRARAASAAAAAAARLIAERHGPEADKAMVDRAIEKLA